VVRKKVKKPLKKERLSDAQHQRARVPTDDELDAELKETKCGETSLTEFLDSADKNVEDKVGYSDENDLPIVLLFVRALGNFFAAVRLAASGQLISECYAQLCICLECFLYAFRIHQGGTAAAQVWLQRHNSDESEKQCKKNFQPKDIYDQLIASYPKLGGQVRNAYQTCIDFGAHPNERSVIPNLEFYEQDERTKIRVNLLNTREPFFKPCLVMVVNVGIYTLQIFEKLYPQEFNSLNVGIKVTNIERTLRRIKPAVLYGLKSSDGLTTS